MSDGASPSGRYRRRWLGAAALIVTAPIVWFFLRSAEPAQSRETRAFSNFESFSAFTKAQTLNQRGTSDVVVRTVGLFQSAVDLDPGSAMALSELARALVRAGRLQLLPGDDVFARAERAATRAVELDPSLSTAHAALGAVLFWSERRWDAAEAELKTALELDPADVATRRDYARLLSALGRHQQAEAEIERAWRLDRLAPLTSLDAGWIYYYSGRFDDAIDECRFARDLIPQSREVRSCLFAAHLQKRRFGGALALDQLEPVSTLDAARLHMMLGHVDSTLREIERAAAEDVSTLAHLAVDPCFHSLRFEPRFQRLLGDLGFD